LGRQKVDGSQFAIAAELMDEFASTALAVVWSRGPWRCVYCKRANDQSWVVLYHRGEIALKRRVLSIEQMLDTAMFWKEAMAADLPLMERLVRAPRQDRRQLPDRRRVFRGGRRVSDRR
jgi:hypothetical protein